MEQEGNPPSLVKESLEGERAGVKYVAKFFKSRGVNWNNTRSDSRESLLRRNELYRSFQLEIFLESEVYIRAR